jgi:hypothetical protein
MAVSFYHSIPAEEIVNPGADDLLAEIHDLARRVNIGWADRGTFKCAVTTPDAISTIHQRQQGTAAIHPMLLRSG